MTLSMLFLLYGNLGIKGNRQVIRIVNPLGSSEGEQVTPVHELESL